MGTDAVVVGSDGRDLTFSGIRLRGRPRRLQRYTMPNGSQGELRSHGFFYRSTAAKAGVLGLPVVDESDRSGYRNLFEGSAAVLFVRNAHGRFASLGRLKASRQGELSDGCRASCVDWYGNARPIFLADRVFALPGYELAEGRVSPDGIGEVRRVNFAPPVVPR